MRDPAFALLPVIDRADKTVAWIMSAPGGASDGVTVLDLLAAADDLARLGGGRPLLVPLPPAAVRATLSRGARPGALVPLIESAHMAELDAALLRRAPGSTTPLPIGLMASSTTFVPARAWAKSWCVLPTGDLAQLRQVSASGAVPIAHGSDTRASRRALWQIPQALSYGAPVGAAAQRSEAAVSGLERVVRILVQLADGRGAGAELEALADDDADVSRALQHAISAAGIGARPAAGGGAAVMAMRVLGRDPILQRLATVAAERSASAAGTADLAAQLLVRAALTRACLLDDPRGTLAPTAYIAGFVSLLDIALAQPLALLVERLGASSGLAPALLDRSGPLGDALDAAEAIANGWWADAGARRPIERMGDAVRVAWRTARRDLASLRT
ncbi:MAG: hypothetical protein MUE41_07040 [Gemmatimonadaceae bacterium]|jgi:hypothetical protein|nr:hypothetical protein [Gemmatimonadaceae bacterium]